MTSILEIIQIKVNPRFTSEPDLFVQLRVGAQKGGVKEQLFGLSVERTDELTWILLFEKAEDQASFAWPKDHGDFNEKIAEIAVGEFKSYTTPFDVKAWRAIESSPITEFACITIKAAASLEQSKPVMDLVVKAVTAAPGGHGGAWGVVREDAKKHLVVVGWDSVEAHVTFTTTELFQKQVIEGIQSIVEDMKTAGGPWHVPLKKHQ